MKKYHLVLAISFWIWISGCNEPAPAEDISSLNWEQILEKANGSVVNLMMWQGDPYINAYMSNYVAPAVKDMYNIDLRIAGGQGSEIVSLIMTEIEAGKPNSQIDMMWINGETFYQLRQIKGLYGPFTDRLPNSQFIDFDNPFIGIDFQQKVDGYECPWGNVQLAIIYNSDKVEKPPMDLAELEAYVKSNPGVFTFETGFTGMTLLKSFLISIAGGPDALKGDFDEAKYKQSSAELWAYINRIKPWFWKKGEDFPASVSAMHQMFSNGELDFTMSNNDGEVDNKVLLGTLPESARAYVFESGTIQNSHYMGIADRAPTKAAAMVVCNFLISPEAQWKKMDPATWGDGTILDTDKLPVEWQDKFANIPNRRFAPARDSIQQYARMELAPEYMIRLYEDFRKNVIED